MLPVCALMPLCVFSQLSFDSRLCLCSFAVLGSSYYPIVPHIYLYVNMHTLWFLIVSLLMFSASDRHPDLTCTLCARSLRLFRPPSHHPPELHSYLLFSVAILQLSSCCIHLLQ